jgi:hypothetical protein
MVRDAISQEKGHNPNVAANESELLGQQGDTNRV